MKTLIFITLSFISTLAFCQSKHDLQKFGLNDQLPIPKGLSVGSVAPDFTQTDQHGTAFNLAASLKNGPVIVVFYRGVWCGICSKHLMALEQDLDLLTQKGAQVVAISPEIEKFRNETANKTGVSFSLLSDTNGEIMKAYDVAFTVTENYLEKVKDFANMNLSDNHNQTIPELPVPATYIIGSDGIIKHVFFNPNYTHRSTVKDLLTYL